MRILVTNDDGINAPGLGVLEAIAAKLSKDVSVVAPEMEQSGVAHSLTLHTPLRVREISKHRYAISGTPTDCVLLAVRTILKPKQKPYDIVLSGINRGSNVSEDVTYSGTVAAAMEGTLLGIPSIAMSQSFTDGRPVHWETAKQHAPALIKKLVKAGWPRGTLLNINFPDCPPSKVRGVKLAPQGKRKIGEKVTERLDPKGRPYYWIGSDRNSPDEAPGSDIRILSEGYITVTPLGLDLTNYKVMEELRERAKL